MLNTGKLKINQAVQTERVLLKLRKVSFTGARTIWPSLQWADGPGYRWQASWWG